MNPQKKMKLTILNNNTMKKIIFLIMISFISLKSMAGDGDKFFNISGGWQWQNRFKRICQQDDFSAKWCREALHTDWNCYD